MSSAFYDVRAASLCCWVCGADDAVAWKAEGLPRRVVSSDLRVTDHHYGATLPLWKCRRCGFLFADRGRLGELVSLYEDLSDPDYEEGSESRALQMRWLLALARQRNPHARSLLDVGAGTGLLVGEAARQGLEAVGVEPCREFVEWGRRQRRVSLLQGILPHAELAGRRFDLVFLVDVIEHVSDPVGLLRQGADMLKRGGLLLVVTPDVASLAARILGRRWWHFRVAHVGYFDRCSLERALAAAGLRPSRWLRPRWFFPVGYLAQRVADYLPVAWLNRWAETLPPLAWLYRRVIPLNLRDSWAVFAQRDRPDIRGAGRG